MLKENGLTFNKVIILIGKCDLRKGIDGLSSIVRLKYNQNPLEKDTLFLFCGTRKDRLKGVVWTGDRFILLYMRLVEGSFQWPTLKRNQESFQVRNSCDLWKAFQLTLLLGKSVFLKR